MRPAVFVAVILAGWIALAWDRPTSAQDEQPLPAAREKANRPEPPAKDRFHIYLLMGQDNMAGRGSVWNEDRKTHRRIFRLTDDGRWIQAAEPLHADSLRLVGVGPGMSFARRMAEADDETAIGLVPCAVAGSSLERWEKGGDLYQAALIRARAAAEKGTLKGVLWHHGELDSRRGPDAVTYGLRLERMIADFRQDLKIRDLPFVVGKLYRFLPADEFPYAHLVNRALEKIPQRLPMTACVDANALSGGLRPDHFNTKSARELGKRYYEALRTLQITARRHGGQPRKRLR